jgi:hypothetical protein
LRITSGHLVLVARLLAEPEAHGGAALQHHGAVLQRPDADFGALQVLEDAYGAADLGLERADRVVAALVVLLRAVTEVQAEDVGASFEQTAEHDGLGARRPERGDNLRLALPLHRVPPFYRGVSSGRYGSARELIWRLPV